MSDRQIGKECPTCHEQVASGTRTDDDSVWSVTVAEGVTAPNLGQGIGIGNFVTTTVEHHDDGTHTI